MAEVKCELMNATNMQEHNDLEMRRQLDKRDKETQPLQRETDGETESTQSDGIRQTEGRHDH